MINPSWRHFVTRKRFEVVFESKNGVSSDMGIESGRRKIINHVLYRDREIHPRVKDFQRPRLGKPRRGLQIFDTLVDFPVPVQSRGRFL